ncbi:hypothetical protein F7725_005750 [Dissostichus mawsoni]|uniref:unspecific monooxygenase n=1 Tax=Dissostichus mawsoni TaxID=36200 RepID=A0A7J5YSG5_DISMA|nr:hypothetical protein F7725_005750 [Dissostichus mawsoni]
MVTVLWRIKNSKSRPSSLARAWGAGQARRPGKIPASARASINAGPERASEGWRYLRVKNVPPASAELDVLASADPGCPSPRKLYLCRISTNASLIITRANRIPMQFLGPAPKGMFELLWLGPQIRVPVKVHVGTITTISLGITRPFISTVALATRSRRGAIGYNRRDSLMTPSRYSISIRAWYGKWTHGIFEKLGIPGPKPYTYWGTVYYEDDMECAKKYGQIWGSYEFRKPVLAVMDPDMVKAIIVKECFTYFTNRRNFRLNGDLYDAISIVEDDEWRRIRHILTPSFTSGRIKEMFSLMKHHSSKLTTSLHLQYGCDGQLCIQCGCGLNKQPSHPLIKHASKLFKFNPLLFIFQDLLQHMINSQTASEAKKEKQNKGFEASFPLHPSSCISSALTGLTDHEIVSQATMFMFAGYETSALTLVALAYSLARNPEVMKRLQEEIDSTFPKKVEQRFLVQESFSALHGSVQYEELMQMEYLDTGRLERIAKETVKISGITIPKDMLVMVPVYALHRDPELWPEPEEFRPDRFSKQNKQSINPYTYLPFGLGPRNCIGMRFALVLIKLAMVEVLQNYSFSVCEETEVIPLIMDPEGLVGPLKPIKLKLVTR